MKLELLGEDQTSLKLWLMSLLAGLVSMEWLSWAIADWLTGCGEEPMGSPCFMCEAHTNSERGSNPPHPRCTAAKFTPSPPTPTNTHPPPSVPLGRWSPQFSEIITHRIEPQCREASAAFDVQQQICSIKPSGSCIWILRRRYCMIYHDLLCEAGGGGWGGVGGDQRRI